MRGKLLAICLPLILITGLAAAQPNVWHVVNGVLHGPGFVTAGPVLNGDGTAAAPAYSFASETGSGWYLRTANKLSGAVAGTLKIDIGASDVEILTTLAINGANLVTFGGDTSLSRVAANRLDLATGDSFNMVGGGGALQMAAVPIISSTAPTVTSAGTSPSVAGTNTAAFRVNVGTGGTATTIVMAMPTATTGWNCDVENITAAAANRANQTMKQQASTTTSVTVQNQTVSTGAALAFTASDIVAFQCMAY